MKFLVLPDTQDAAATLERTPFVERERSLLHDSGRPWIVGSWDDGEVVTGTFGSSRVALFGSALTTSSSLDRALARRQGLEQLDAIARSVPGSYHLIASVAGVTRVQGSLSGTHEVFWTTAGGTALAADRPDVLAELTGGAIDDIGLLGHFMSRSPWPLSARTVWQEVECLGLGEYLHLALDGTARPVRWWTPPAEELPLAQATERVKTALRNAVAARAASAARLGCDVSGGMDSTSVAFTLHQLQSNTGMVTVRHGARDAANDDAEWAARAGDSLTDSEPLVVGVAQCPASFADQLSLDDDLEAPYAWSKTKARVAHIAGRLADRGVSLHLTGHGGDELFFPAPSTYHVLPRRYPLRSVPHMRAARSMFRWPLGAMTSNLLRNPTYGEWLTTAARELTSAEGGPRQPLTSWGGYPRLPAWVTADAVDACGSMLRTAAQETDPYSCDPVQHDVLHGVRQCGSKIRLANRLTLRHGVGYDTPYLDAQVVEAALSARLIDRFSTARSKPVLAAAMRGTVPEAILGRTTKGEFSADVYAGVRRHKEELLELCDGMRLAERGLVDEEAVRAVLMAPHPMARTFIPMVPTLACESWLRSVEAARGQRRRSTEGARAS
ncbi:MULTISPECIES: asparagine synthase-related protein [unclassified Streptomyces]|uniref:asparagine synthase-related protein n=1 Tax=unclassified Streptomyces TaxID=2593676 RepID=UPI002DD9EF0A|nr:MULTISPECIES: asparagine synthase-related protein [unclassified Streptomyces]WSA90724.1 asparagine synthase-related protein [Streptomyces sp. NBC_01795]WSB75048.1 asparagine synthase-related protein [Streptomyces sp. NBC_01775]WSS16672.1 asparagine synthase-related protein [Streptomyces sp. NBC_01186]WSS45490.1 asparagine synthase-related protein [Streptomyces sp. NBC_01187]